MRRFSWLVFLGLCGACVVHALYYWPRLPEEVASHFGLDGRPDGWATKGEFVGVYLGSVAVLAVMFAGIGFVTKRMPARWINLPNKEYWLSQERREATYDFMVWYLLWMGSATMVFLLDVFHQAVRVNLGQAERLEHMGIGLGVFLGFTAVWTVGFVVRFARKKELDSADA